MDRSLVNHSILPSPFKVQGLTNASIHLNDSLCVLSESEKEAQSACLSKIEWLQKFWKTDACYEEYGVDGSMCSIRYYLSQFENWCPPLAFQMNSKSPQSQSRRVQASWNTNLTSLTHPMSTSLSHDNYAWIIDRISRLWHLWISAVEAINTKTLLKSPSRTKKRILIYLGFLSKKSGFKFQQSASAGGPLGEMVQWSDILSVLHVLGHHLTITSEYNELSSKLSQLPNMKSQCQVSQSIPYDVIITDITGLIHFKKHVKQGYGKFSCMLWIIDSFGTEAAFNHKTYATKHKHYGSAWGKHDLNLKQFFTMFPHSPDNSFMGFVVEQHLKQNETQVSKKQQAVVYGKSQYMWNGKETFLKTISKFVQIHGTVYTDFKSNSILPPFLVNHGILPGPDLQRLLLESKLFIGLGFPYEGPAPLEAIAAGCVFINPKFDPAHNSDNTKFFKGKPTKRGLSSQHPYAEYFISQPNVFTVDVADLKEVERVVAKAIELVENGTVQGYLPREFTHEGMLERVNTYLEHQDFCRHDHPWPPESAIKVLVSQPHHSCMQACWTENLICEPSHFQRLNKLQELHKWFRCDKQATESNLYYPGYDVEAQTCVLQKETLLFSCVDKLPNFLRLCPCRSYIRGQMALCPDCL